MIAITASSSFPSISATTEARIKLYIAHDYAATDRVESDLAGIAGYTGGDAKSWIRELVGRDGPFDARPILTCFALTSTNKPPAVTVYVPVRCYSPSDAYTVDRACRLLGPEDGSRLREALARMAGRPLDVGRGLVTYVAVRRQASGLNVTVYVAPEVYAIGAPRPSDALSHTNGTPPLHSMIQALRPRPTEERPIATMVDVEGMTQPLDVPAVARAESSMLLGAMGAKRIRVEKYCVVVTWLNVCAVVWRHQTRAEDVRLVSDVLYRLSIEHPEGIGLVQYLDDRSESVSLDAEARSAISELLSRGKAYIKCSSIVFTGLGFRASAVRAVVTGITWLARPGFPHTVFASADAAEAQASVFTSRESGKKWAEISWR